MPIQDITSLLTTIPSLPGVYRFQSEDGSVLYVGKALSLKKRVSSYFQKTRQSPRITLMLQETTSIDTIITASEAEALLLENNLIKSLRPRYNILFRDDKSYPYLRLSKHSYPRLMFYRGVVKEDAHYFGPFPDTKAVKETIDVLQRVFRLRTCTDSVLTSRQRPCLLHSIGRCSAPCTNKISPVEYAAAAKQSQHFLQGHVSTISELLKTQMQTAADSENFEEAVILRDRLRALAVVRSQHFAEGDDINHADYIGIYHDNNQACVNIIMVRGGRRVGEKRLFPDNTDNDITEIARAFLIQYYRAGHPEKIFLQPLPEDWQEVAPHLFSAIVPLPNNSARMRLNIAVTNAKQALITNSVQKGIRSQQLSSIAKTLLLSSPPKRMECFDISHSMGEETVASRVVFVNGLAYRQDYRLYRIKTVENNDPGAMYEVVLRCYRRQIKENNDMPDVIFVDGGITQLKAALRAFADIEMTPPAIFAIAKGISRRPGEETLISAEGEIIEFPKRSPALLLIQNLRDEAHRFAISGHRRRRDKKRSRFSSLDDVEGIGEKKRQLLLVHFGGLQALRAASTKELVKIPGVGIELASRIYRALH